MNPTTPLPSLPGDAMLLVFTRPNSATGLGDDPTYGTLEQLVSIGKRFLGAAYIDVLCDQQRPIPEVEVLQAIDTTLDSLSVEWAERYSLSQKVYGVSAEDSVTDPDAENRRLFYTYTGALFKSPDGGYAAIRRWIAALLGVQPSAAAPAYPPPQQGLYPPVGVYSAPGGPSGAYQQPPPYPIMTGAQPPGLPPLPGPLSPPVTPSKPVPTYLPFLNQMVQKGRLDVRYDTTSTGQPHMPHWTAQCFIGGMPKGVGQGTSKQVAKEVAAREACHAMGWTPV
ncbi:hypothetical protein C8Q79DRAFT_985617 [Trametes meyenii]|nr:hypothetical protein C8Q79DRAFT_985617 [Trametes meyenii]